MVDHACNHIWVLLTALCHACQGFYEYCRTMCWQMSLRVPPFWFSFELTSVVLQHFDCPRKFVAQSITKEKLSKMNLQVSCDSTVHHLAVPGPLMYSSLAQLHFYYVFNPGFTFLTFSLYIKDSEKGISSSSLCIVVTTSFFPSMSCTVCLM